MLSSFSDAHLRRVRPVGGRGAGRSARDTRDQEARRASPQDAERKRPVLDLVDQAVPVAQRGEVLPRTQVAPASWVVPSVLRKAGPEVGRSLLVEVGRSLLDEVEHSLGEDGHRAGPCMVEARADQGMVGQRILVEGIQRIPEGEAGVCFLVVLKF